MIELPPVGWVRLEITLGTSMFSINFKVTIGASDGEAERFATHYTGEVFVYRPETDEEEFAGRIGLFLIFAEAADEAGISLHDVFDLEAATSPYAALLHDAEAGNFCPAVLRILDEGDMVISRDMIILDRMEILPRFRGKRLGLHIMQACLNQFAWKSRIAAIKPFPLQLEGAKDKERPVERREWAEKMNLDGFTKDERRATARLKSYYAQLGFAAVRGTDLMIRDLDAEGASLDGSELYED